MTREMGGWTSLWMVNYVSGVLWRYYEAVDEGRQCTVCLTKKHALKVFALIVYEWSGIVFKCAAR